MKALRLFVLLLLAVLLPLRGAVAATMVCAEPGEANQTVMAVGAAHHDMHSGHPHGSDHDVSSDAQATHGDHAVHPPSVADSHDDGAWAASDTCHICASGCHAAALATTAPVVAGPVMTAKVVFPTISAPAPAFQSDGQERPPRSI